MKCASVWELQTHFALGALLARVVQYTARLKLPSKQHNRFRIRCAPEKPAFLQVP